MWRRLTEVMVQIQVRRGLAEQKTTARERRERSPEASRVARNLGGL
jgi:hypothetical protein